MIAYNQTTEKFVSYICQAPAWDGKDHFEFSEDINKAVDIPEKSVKSVVESWKRFTGDVLVIFNPKTQRIQTYMRGL